MNRARKHSESFKQYRANQKDESEALKKQLKGNMVFVAAPIRYNPVTQQNYVAKGISFEYSIPRQAHRDCERHGFSFI